MFCNMDAFRSFLILTLLFDTCLQTCTIRATKREIELSSYAPVWYSVNSLFGGEGGYGGGGN